MQSTIQTVAMSAGDTGLRAGERSKAITDDAVGVSFQRMLDAVGVDTLADDDMGELDAMMSAYDAEILRSGDEDSAAIAACEYSLLDLSLSCD